MLVVLNLVRSVDAHHGLNRFIVSDAPGPNIHNHSRLDATRDSFDIEYFETIQTQAFGGFPRLELKGKHSHPHQVASVNSFEAFRDDCLHAE